MSLQVPQGALRNHDEKYHMISAYMSIARSGGGALEQATLPKRLQVGGIEEWHSLPV
jgi:hypothetical protein